MQMSIIECAMGAFQIISLDGSADEEHLPELSTSQMLKMYRDMVLARRLDSWLMRLQRMGRVAIHAPSEGQEAAMVGSAHALETEDWVFPSYREMPVYIARGVPISELLNRQFSNEEDPLHGHDMAVYGSRRYQIIPAPVPVGMQIPMAVGFAMAAKYRGEKAVAITYFGDGATSKGDFHEALNFAGVFKAPVVFFCQNNQYAISCPYSRQTATKTIAEKAVAYGFEGVWVDGNDILACYSATKRAIEKARRGEGPTLIEAFTYRLGPHTTADDPSRYREQAEVEKWREKDPIARFKRFLVRRGLWSEEDDAKLYEEIEEDIKREIEQAERKQPLRPDVIFADVYGSEPWHLAEERDELSRLI